jgi:hypothetical protein
MHTDLEWSLGKSDFTENRLNTGNALFQSIINNDDDDIFERSTFPDMYGSSAQKTVNESISYEENFPETEISDNNLELSWNSNSNSNAQSIVDLSYGEYNLNLDTYTGYNVTEK